MFSQETSSRSEENCWNDEKEIWTFKTITKNAIWSIEKLSVMKVSTTIWKKDAEEIKFIITRDYHKDQYQYWRLCWQKTVLTILSYARRKQNRCDEKKKKAENEQKFIKLYTWESCLIIAFIFNDHQMWLLKTVLNDCIMLFICDDLVNHD